MTSTGGINTQVRNVGSNYTTFQWDGKPIAYLESFTDSGVTPYSESGQGYEFITPLGQTHPTDVVTSRVLNGGTITCTIRELWGKEVWEHLSGLAGTQDIVALFAALAKRGTPVTCTKIITPPNGKSTYGKHYYNCVVVSVMDGETVTIGALSVPKNVVIAYTHAARF